MEKITQGVPTKVTQTNVIEMEYLLLPVVDTSVRFLYRFHTPIDMVWMTDGRVSHWLDKNKGKGLEVLLEEFAVKKVRELVLENTKIEDMPPEAQWLLKMDKVRLTRCKIVKA